MNRSALAARAAALPASLHLPIKAPRDAWPALIEHAADALAGRCIFDSETLALELRAIAEALRCDHYADLLAALRACIEAEQPMAHMHAAEGARALLRRVGGGA
ncbi:MAG: hypothetical protein GXC76_01870 [Rhodanobacteraceae bacterium]|jgi:hypothetical protein|nr:hypothetical protein [Rhodanobacteraceae bacterium]